MTAVVSVNWLEIFTALIFKKVMKYYDITNKVPIPPSSTVEIRSEVPEGIVSLVSEERIAVSQDDALSITVEIDGEVRGSDPSVKQQIYATPTNWFALGALTPVEKEIKIKIKNNTTSMQYVWITSRYGRLPKKVFEEIVQTHFDAVLEMRKFQGE